MNESVTFQSLNKDWYAVWGHKNGQVTYTEFIGRRGLSEDRYIQSIIRESKPHTKNFDQDLVPIIVAKTLYG